MIVAKHPNTHWTVLDGEAILLNVENGVYYTLNRVGTAMWELLTEERPFAGVLAVICERFDVTEEVARKDLTALITRLQHEGLLVTRE